MDVPLGEMKRILILLSLELNKIIWKNSFLDKDKYRAPQSYTNVGAPKIWKEVSHKRFPLFFFVIAIKTFFASKNDFAVSNGVMVL